MSKQKWPAVLIVDHSMQPPGGGHAVAAWCIQSFCNEMDFGRTGIQYVHYPWLTFLRPDNEHRWFHLKVLLSIYYKLTQSISGFSKVRVAKNITLCNSQFIADMVDSVYQNQPEVLHPPALGKYKKIKWIDKQYRFISISRFSPEKRLIEQVNILRKVRERGYPVKLEIIGSRDHPDVFENLMVHVRDLSEWVKVHVDLSREDLDQLLSQSRFGLHGMHFEHFGMVVAEMLRAGCIPFVHNSGGQIEIVGNDDLLCYNNDDDAVNKICSLLSDDQKQTEIFESLKKRYDRYSPESFSNGIKQHVAEFLEKR
ncbi:MAG: glycosyltransferase [Gammaproteobacteria bacterium]